MVKVAGLLRIYVSEGTNGYYKAMKLNTIILAQKT